MGTYAPFTFSMTPARYVASIDPYPLVFLEIVFY